MTEKIRGEAASGIARASIDVEHAQRGHLAARTRVRPVSTGVLPSARFFELPCCFDVKPGKYGSSTFSWGARSDLQGRVAAGVCRSASEDADSGSSEGRVGSTCIRACIRTCIRGIGQCAKAGDAR